MYIYIYTSSMFHVCVFILAFVPLVTGVTPSRRDLGDRGAARFGSRWSLSGAGRINSINWMNEVVVDCFDVWILSVYTFLLFSHCHIVCIFSTWHFCKFLWKNMLSRLALKKIRRDSANLSFDSLDWSGRLAKGELPGCSLWSPCARESSVWWHLQSFCIASSKASSLMARLADVIQWTTGTWRPQPIREPFS